MTLSLIIPVYGQWPLLKACLLSVPSAMEGFHALSYEVILVNNAASQAQDAVHAEAPNFGRALFAENFHYIPQPLNRNFAGACNIGAQMATGQFLCFLNSDTALTKGCILPLIEALKQNPALFAVGPMLVYPKDFMGVERVQHAGITLGPDMKVSHVYENFPSSHPIFQKKRPLQAITAAMLVCEKKRFEALGGFCEEFINGFEDLDLCKTAAEHNGRVQVVPSVKVTHYCGQSAGRGAHDAHNAKVLAARGAMDFFHPDYHTLLAEDGYTLTLTPWLKWQAVPEPRKTARLQRMFAKVEVSEIQELEAALQEEPYWLEGWQLCIEQTAKAGQIERALLLAQLALAFDEGPMPLRSLAKLAQTHGDANLAAQAREALAHYTMPEAERLTALRSIRALMRAKIPALVPQVDAALEALPVFLQKVYLPFWENLR